jgi:hypothetical protein
MTELSEKMGLSASEFEEMVRSVEFSVATAGCDHSYEGTMKFLARRHGFSQAEIVRVREALAEVGICCDCDLAKRNRERSAVRDSGR